MAITFGYTSLQWGNQSMAQVPNELSDVMLVRFNKANGNLIQIKDIEGNHGHGDYGTALAADIYGNYIVGGKFGNFLYLPGQTLVNGAAGSDFFVAKYGSANCSCILLEPDFTYTAGSTGGDFMFNYTGTNYQSILWDFGGGVTASGENPQHTFTQSGNHDVCVTITSSCGSEQHCTQVNALLGIDNKEMTVKMYPNPVKDKLTINSTQELSYQIFTLLGSRLQSGNILEGQAEISFAELSPGWYLLLMSDISGQQKTVKLFKE